MPLAIQPKSIPSNVGTKQLAGIQFLWQNKYVASKEEFEGKMTANDKLRFIHLSDIHFSHKAAEFGYDPDSELRAAVIADVKATCAKLGAANGALVSGDIAYAAKRVEYDDAARWLDAVTEAAGCALDSVWICPGNHDVDRDVLKNNPLLLAGYDKVLSHDEFRHQDSELERLLIQSEVRKQFYAPLATYNDFAVRYGSNVFADQAKFAPEHDFTLNDGSILRLRALNTALLSSPSDREGRLFLGERAWTFPRHPAVEYMTIAHHPPSWLADKRDAEVALEADARIQLFGHVHDQRFQLGQDWVKLYAGSINPHRSEPHWKPGYNIIEVSVEAAARRCMLVEIHAREWQADTRHFRAIEDRQKKPVHTARIELPDLPEGFAPKTRFEKSGELEPFEAIAAAMAQERESIPVAKADFRALVFRFFRLTLSAKNEIVGRMHLAEETDSQLVDVERFKIALVRANDAGALDRLEALITEMEGKV
jgi:GTPase-associated adaptor domain/Calcineurin-like phosphoesterase